MADTSCSATFEAHPGTPIPVAQYVRMSTEHQRYSTENQAQVIAEYAAQHGMLIVQTYQDEGKSGLSIEGRAALRGLLADVQRHDVSFAAILVYDVSRWGDFQIPTRRQHMSNYANATASRLSTAPNNSITTTHLALPSSRI